MRALNELFQTTFPVDAVVECFVTRLRGRGAAILVVGSEPTTLSITLADGRRLRATSRGPGPKQDAINSVVRWINEWKANQALAALSHGRAFQFGTVQLTPEGIVNKGQLTRWNEIAGWAIRRGGLVYDDANGRLAGEVWLPRIPFGDALCLVVAHMLPDKNYQTMPRGAGPKHGFFSVTARTHIPGASKYARRISFGIIPALIALGVSVYGVAFAWDWIARATTPKPDPHGRVDEAVTALRDPSSIDGVPACSPDSPRSSKILFSADKSKVFRYRDYFWHPTTFDQVGYVREFFLWSEQGGVVQFVDWDAVNKRPSCVVRVPIPAGQTAERMAIQMASGRFDF